MNSYFTLTAFIRWHTSEEYLRGVPFKSLSPLRCHLIQFCQFDIRATSSLVICIWPSIRHWFLLLFLIQHQDLECLSCLIFHLGVLFSFIAHWNLFFRGLELILQSKSKFLMLYLEIEGTLLKLTYGMGKGHQSSWVMKHQILLHRSFKNFIHIKPESYRIKRQSLSPEISFFLFKNSFINLCVSRKSNITLKMSLRQWVFVHI